MTYFEKKKNYPFFRVFYFLVTTISHKWFENKKKPFRVNKSYNFKGNYPYVAHMHEWGGNMNETKPDTLNSVGARGYNETPCIPWKAEARGV